MRPKSLLVLTAIVAVLGGFILFFERDLPSTEERAKQEKKVIGLDQDQVTAVVIEPKDGTAVRLEKEAAAAPADADDKKKDEPDDAFAPAPAAEWRLVAPLTARADRTRAEDLVRSLVDLEKGRTLEGVDRAAAGLDAPRFRIRLATAEEELHLAVGGEVPASKDVFLAVGDAGPIYQVSGSFVESLGRAAGDWRDRKVFPGTRADVERLKLGAGAQETLLARRGEDFWVESPLTDRADTTKTNELLSRVTDLEVSTFVDVAPADPSTLGLDPPAATVEVVRKDKPEAFLVELGAVVADEAGARYARAGGQLFTTKSELLASVETPIAGWRSKKWTAQQVFRIEKATFADSQGELVLRRDDAEWYRGADDESEEKIDYASASDLLYALTDVEATEVVDPGAPSVSWTALAQPELTVALDLQEEAKETLKLFVALDGRAAATSEGRQATLVLAPEAVAKVRDALAKVRAAPAQKDETSEETAEEDEPAADAAPDDAADDAGGEPDGD